MTEDELRHIEAVLAGVEGYTQRDLFEQGKQLVSEVHCLRAENAALKTQAARDAKVVRHAAEYVALNTEMDDLNEADIDYIERSDELWLRADKAWESLCAALAEREE